MSSIENQNVGIAMPTEAMPSMILSARLPWCEPATMPSTMASTYAVRYAGSTSIMVWGMRMSSCAATLSFVVME